jgi:hypothetical protein
MPQARSAGTSPKKPAAKSTPAKPAAARTAAAKPAAAKAAAAKPAAKRAAAKPTASKASTAKASTAKATTSTKAAAAKPAAKPAAGKASAAKAPAAKARPRVTIHVNTGGTQVEAVAERVRKLNERIIEVGREAGGSTLASYEKALKAIATGISQGPAKDELDWITHLASSQAKFVRDMTESLAKAARERLK